MISLQNSLVVLQLNNACELAFYDLFFVLSLLSKCGSHCCTINVCTHVYVWVCPIWFFIFPCSLTVVL